MIGPGDGFALAIDELAQQYGKTVFYTERDVVFTVQTTLVRVLARTSPTLRVFNDYKMRDQARVDLAVVDTGTNAIHLAVEFKYEPDRARDDIPRGKFPVTVRSEIERDLDRVRGFVSSGQAHRGVAVLIDEDGRYDVPAAQWFGTRVDLGEIGVPGGGASGWLRWVN